MQIFDSLDISASGLSAQRRKLTAISSNIANVDTTRTDEGGPYKRRRVVMLESPQLAKFSNMLADQQNRLDLTSNGHLPQPGTDSDQLSVGAGLAPKVLDFAAATDQVLLLTTPEATAIADAYALLKILLQRRPALTTGLLVNMAESAKEAAELQEKFAELANRFLGAQIHNWGYIPLDRYVREAAKRQIPFTLATPPPPAARALARLAENLVEGQPTTAPQGLFAPLWRQFLSSGSPKQAPT